MNLFQDARDEQKAELREELVGQIDAYIDDLDNRIDVGGYVNGMRTAIQIISRGD